MNHCPSAIYIDLNHRPLILIFSPSTLLSTNTNLHPQHSKWVTSTRAPTTSGSRTATSSTPSAATARATMSSQLLTLTTISVTTMALSHGEARVRNQYTFVNQQYTDFTQTSLALLPTSPSTSKAMITFPFSAPS